MTDKPPSDTTAQSWYCACQHCTAKWYSEQAQPVCPRCGFFANHPEQCDPPWMKREVVRKRPADTSLAATDSIDRSPQ